MIAQEREHLDGFTKAMRGLGGEVEAGAEEVDVSSLKGERDFLLLAYELGPGGVRHRRSPSARPSAAARARGMIER